MKSPTISVVMPVYNAERYVAEAIESILNQTYTDFEFIILNDGSTDGSLDIINHYARLDSRITVVSRENKGLVATLNEGIDLAKGEYIARMDADDISLVDRFLLQVEYLLNNDNVNVVGCIYSLIDENSIRKGKPAKVPLTDEDILMCMCYTVPFAHPSVMVRKDLIKKHFYQESPTEDYLLWSMLYKHNSFANVDKELFLYRHQYGSSFSDTKRIKMIKSEFIIAKEFMTKHMESVLSVFNDQGFSYYKYRAFSMFLLVFNLKYKVQFIRNPKLIFYSSFFFVRHLIRLIYWGLKR